MNERIKELADQAELTIRTGRGNTYVSHPEFNKKFAELIVRECIDIVYEIGDYSNGLTKNKRSRNGLFASMIGKTIKEKFGIN